MWFLFIISRARARAAPVSVGSTQSGLSPRLARASSLCSRRVRFSGAFRYKLLPRRS